MDIHSELTLSVESNGVEIGDHVEEAMQHLEGDENLNLTGQTQDILNGLPDLNVVLGPIQAHQPLLNDNQLPPVQLLEPQVQVPMFEFINLIPPAQQLPHEEIDLNLAVHVLHAQSEPICNSAQLL